MTAFVLANFFQTTLSANVATGDTTINVASASGAPTIASTQRWPLVIQSAATPSVREVVYVTAITGTAFTVVRAQEGTTAQSWSTADLVSGDPTAGSVAQMGALWSGGTGALSTNTTLAATAANIYWQVSGGTQTLPASSGVTGATFGFFATAACTIATNGTDTFQGGALSGTTSVALAAGDWLVLQSSGAGAYDVVSASPAVLSPSSLASSGWKKYPDTNSPTGFVIEQWGSVPSILASGSVTVSYPIAFPTGVLSVVAVAGATAFGDPPFAGVDATSGTPKSSFKVWNSSPTTVTQPGLYRAIGY